MPFNLADAFTTIAEAIPDNEAVVSRQRRLTFRELQARSNRLANHLVERGLGVRRERAELTGHESGQSHLAIYAYNGSEYLESFFGSFLARVAPLNVNYRYVEEELVYLLTDSHAEAVVYHAEFAPRIAAIRDQLPELSVLIQIADDSGNDLLPGAVDYEETLAASSPERPDVECSPDDLYILYTGGTTGMPKGVLWRSEDIFIAAMGGAQIGGDTLPSYEALADQARAGAGGKALVGPPLMHGAAQWSTMISMTMGAGVVFPDEAKHFDARDFLETAERENVTIATIVGDAFARPLIEELRRGDYALPSLVAIGSGGATLSVTNKEALLELLPNIMVSDGMGSSEAGAQTIHVSTKGSTSSGKFDAGKAMIILSEDLTRVLGPDDKSIGWLARAGRLPLGYLGDPDKTARTFPVVDGVRYSVPGDRAHYGDDGEVVFLGRDSVCINSGGEKIFAEEVEAAVRAHPDVADAVVAPRPSERWGQEVVAVVALRPGTAPDEAAILAEAERHIARYKLPKAFTFVDSVQRSPSGKPDYRWAKQQAVEAP